MNTETKLEKYYNPVKMRSALFKMEQFFMLWHDKSIDEKRRTVAKGLFEHYRRLAMCILAKAFNPVNINVTKIVTPDYIDNVFKDGEDILYYNDINTANNYKTQSKENNVSTKET